MISLDPVPTPQQLFRWLDSGRITREEFRAAMAVHAGEIIQEMEQAHSNPLVAKFNELMNRREAWKWSRRHGELLMREILCALMDEERFAPARWLWNAAHPHIPLHCFFRVRGTPLLRFLEMKVQPQNVTVVIEHGGSDTLPPTREQFFLRRNRQRMLLVERRDLL
ncbi:hypothetical protein [Prosthecobacter sp.]|uniref:hypothetical protein n=1 Tax=Prosthecobacter sp. TaxID=1965333 RepID=UPI001D7E326A|nr:hypothetical protein [Prosthecobacter sp.]MCB1279751.1 hypothetical protein [Prosthecobacter sp.]